MFNSLSVIEFDVEGGVKRSTRGIGAQMVGTHGAVDVVEDIIDTQFQPVAEHLARTSEVVGGVDAPYLIALAVTIVLVVAGAAASC